VIDGRLLAPAAASWGAAVLVTAVVRAGADLSERHDLALRVLIGTSLALIVTVGGASASIRRTQRGLRTVVALAFAGAFLGGAAASAHLVALWPQAVSTWVQVRATATIRGVVTAEAVTKTAAPGSAWRGAPRREFTLASSSVAARGAAVDVDLPFIVRLPATRAVPAVGSEIVLVGRLGPPPPQADVAGVVTVSGLGPQPLVVSPPGLVDVIAGAMRTGLRRALDGTSPDAGALVAGLAIGDESGQSASLRAQMRASGLAHLTAVSGGNVSIVVVAIVALGTALRLQLPVRVTIALLALGFFVVLVGPAPSVIRAAAMAGLVLIGLLVGGRRAGPSVLASAVIVLVVLAPGLTATWGFALSAGATAGVILLSGWLDARLFRNRASARLPPVVRQGLAVTIAAQVATLPLLVAMGSAVGWVSVPANLLAMPVVAPVTVLGLLSAISAPVAPPVAVGLAHAASWPAAWIATVAARCTALPGARLPLPQGWAGVAVLVALGAAATLFAALVRREYPAGVPRTVRGVASAVVVLLVIGGVLLPPSRRAWPPPQWLMIMCDVGQGDALLLHVGEASAVVVDAGPDPDRMHRCLDDAQVRLVPAVILTHFHADHVDGLEGVLRDRPVGAVLATPVRDPPEEAGRVDRLLADHALTAQGVTAGDARTVGSVSWRAVWPRRVITTGSIPNNASVVLVVETAGRRLLLMGDVEPEAQSAVAPDISGLAFDVVKVPHHGSRYQHPLLTGWAPAPVALISVGEGNDYGHPADSTVAAWNRIGAVVVRTDHNGDAAVVPDGSGVGVVVRHGMLPSS
jgi:competence protein ComEC